MEAPASSAMPPPLPDVGEVLASLAEISSTNSEFGQFFGGVLDEFQAEAGTDLDERVELLVLAGVAVNEIRTRTRHVSGP